MHIPEAVCLEIAFDETGLKVQLPPPNGRKFRQVEVPVLTTHAKLTCPEETISLTLPAVALKEKTAEGMLTALRTHMGTSLDRGGIARL